MELAQAALLSDPPLQPPQQSNDLPWCVCNKCRAMPTAIDNVNSVKTILYILKQLY